MSTPDFPVLTRFTSGWTYLPSQGVSLPKFFRSLAFLKRGRGVQVAGDMRQARVKWFPIKMRMLIGLTLVTGPNDESIRTCCTCQREAGFSVRNHLNGSVCNIYRRHL